MSVERSYFFARALLDGDVAQRVRLEVDAGGVIRGCQSDANPQADDVRYAAALPGMPDVHSHAHQYALAGRAEHSREHDSFWTWREVMYRFALRMTPEQFAAIAAQLYVDLLKGGYTSVGEFHYLHHDLDGGHYADIGLMSRQLVDAADQAGIALTLLPVLYRYGDFGKAPVSERQRRFVHSTDDYLQLLSKLAADFRRHPQHTLGMAPHSLRAVDMDDLQVVITDTPLADSAPLHIHVSEQQREVDDCLTALNQRPVASLLGRFDVNERWCLIHATHLDDAEVNQLARSKAVAGLCPTTEANLGDGIFRSVDYLQAGGRIAIGSDSNTALDATGELRLLEYVQRLQRQERNVHTTKDNFSAGLALYDAAARGGAQAIARDCGRLAVGCRADFVTLDAQDPLLCGRDDDIFDAWLFAAGARAVNDVYVAGQTVLRNGQHAQQESIAAACRAALRELAS